MNSRIYFGLLHRNFAIFCSFSRFFSEFGYFWTHLWNSGFFSSKIRGEIAIFMQKNHDLFILFYLFLFIFTKIVTSFLLKLWILSGAKVDKSIRSRKMLQNEYLVAKIGVDTAENEPLQNLTLFIHLFIRVPSGHYQARPGNPPQHPGWPRGSTSGVYFRDPW